MKGAWFFYVAFSFFPLMCSTGFAQNAGTGAIAGINHRPVKRGRTGRSYKSYQSENGEERTANSTSKRSYADEFLQPGTYTVVVSKAGFRDSKYEHVVVTVTETEQLNVALPLGDATETVEVKK